MGWKRGKCSGLNALLINDRLSRRNDDEMMGVIRKNLNCG
jgi:hypothetical protein